MKDFLLQILTIKKKNKKIIQEYIWHIPPVLLSIILLCLIIFHIKVQLEVEQLTLLPDIFSSFHPVDYPLLDITDVPSLSAQAYAVMDKTSHVIFLSKNENIRFSPASTTKMMSILVALQQFKFDDILTVKQLVDTQGSGLGLFLGEQLSFQNLAYGMLLPSANDAAFTVAQNYPHGIDAFVAAMNNEAKVYHLFNTHFGDPAGLADDSDYSSATDLLRIADILMEYPEIAKIVATKNALITDVTGKYTYSVQNRNELLGQFGINGIKTGYTDEAGEVLVTSAILNRHQIFAVVMRSNDRFADTEKLLAFISQHLTYLSMSP